MRRSSSLVTILLATMVIAAGCGGGTPSSTSEATPSATAPAPSTAPSTAAQASPSAPATLPLPSIPAGAVPSLPTSPIDTATAAGLDEQLKAIVGDGAEIPALYVGMWDAKRGAYVRAFGVADKSTGRIADPGDYYRIGSITKTFTATIILQLVDQGVITLDTTLADAAPSVGAAYPEVGDRTIRQLLSMRSGIPDYVDAAIADATSDPQRVWTTSELIGRGIALGLRPADAETNYSTTNTLLLQEAAEEITGKPLATLVKERITEPLGMKNTFIPPQDDTTLPDPQSHGYINPKCAPTIPGPVPVGTDATDWSLSWGAGGGSGISTIADMGIWAASMSGSSLLSPELAAERIASPEPFADTYDYALGIHRFVGGNVWGHAGETLGWEGFAGHDPEQGTSVVVVGTGCSILGEVYRAVSSLNGRP